MQKTEYQRQVWRLRYSLGWPVARISRQLGISKSAVSQSVRRFKRILVAQETNRTPTPKRRVVRPVSLWTVTAEWA